MVSIKPGSAATAAALTLLGAPGSSSTNRLRIALAVKGLPYKFEKVDMGTNESRSEEYRQTMNRLGQIPILQVGAIKLRQTVAQLEFLEEVYPQPPLLPEDPIERARVREIVEIVNSFIQPMQNKLTVEKIAEMDSELAEWLPRAVKAHVNPDGGSGHEEDEVAPILWPHWWIIKGFDSIEGLIDDLEWRRHHWHRRFRPKRTRHLRIRHPDWDQRH